MNLITQFRQRLLSFLRGETYQPEIDEELRFHLEQRTAANVAAGMSPADAARDARKRFGNLQSVREECREKLGAGFGETTWQDVRFGMRMLKKNPGFTLVAVLTLALGIGVNTSMFTALLALLDRPLPYPDPGSLAQVFQSSPGSPRGAHHSAPDFLDYQASGVFKYLAAMNDRPFSLVAPGQPAERVRGLFVSADLFPLLGIQPELGRVFNADEDRVGFDNVVVLDHGFWQRRFGADPHIIGRTLRLDGEVVTVIGVMPPQFRDNLLMGSANLWRPFAFTDQQREERGNHFLKCIARLKPGMSLAQAQAAADVLARQHREAHPDASDERLRLEPLAESSLPPQARSLVWSVMALATFVLLIACANLANLQFARMSTRSREFAIRGALGAARGRLIRQLVSECLLLALIGGAMGLLVCEWSNHLLLRLFVNDGEAVLHLPLNARAFSFALLVSVASGLVFGLGPALMASRVNVNDAIKRGARGTTDDRSHHRIQHLLIVAEMALALMLLASASLVITGLRTFAATDPGWRVKGMSLGYLSLPQTKYANGDELRLFASQLEDRLSGIPGVEQVALCWNLPIRRFNVTSSFTLDGRPEPPPGTSQNYSVNGVTPGYFQTLGMKLLVGRVFTTDDDAQRPPVVIINQTMARTFWPEATPLGQRINGAEIVGVVNDVSFPANPAESRTSYQSYRPYAQEPRGSLTLAVRGSIRPEALRRVVADVDPDLPVGQPGPVSADIENTLGHWEIGGKILSVFALLGLSLAMLGVYGVITGFVARRTGEIGVRMALGAQLNQVLWLVVGKGVRLSLAGAVVGLIGTMGLARLLAAVLPKLPPTNFLLLLGVTGILISIAALAALIPALRAAKVNPMIALRHE